MSKCVCVACDQFEGQNTLVEMNLYYIVISDKQHKPSHNAGKTPNTHATHSTQNFSVFFLIQSHASFSSLELISVVITILFHLMCKSTCWIQIVYNIIFDMRFIFENTLMLSAYAILCVTWNNRISRYLTLFTHVHSAWDPNFTRFHRSTLYFVSIHHSIYAVMHPNMYEIHSTLNTWTNVGHLFILWLNQRSKHVDELIQLVFRMWFGTINITTVENLGQQSNIMNCFVWFSVDRLDTSHTLQLPCHSIWYRCKEAVFYFEYHWIRYFRNLNTII